MENGLHFYGTYFIIFFQSASFKLLALGLRWPRTTIRVAVSDNLELSGFYCLAQGQTAAGVLSGEPFDRRTSRNCSGIIAKITQPRRRINSYEVDLLLMGPQFPISPLLQCFQKSADHFWGDGKGKKEK